MKKDIDSMLKLKANTVEHLASYLHIANSDAIELIQRLEAESVLSIQAPQYADTPATVLVEDKKIAKSTLSMTSHKPGNIILNTYLDWKSLAGVVIASIETISGLNSDNPVLIMTGIASCLLEVSSLSDIKMTENGTAVIMALQQHTKHKVYVTTESQCMKEANEILLTHGYCEMDEQTFQHEIARLEAIKCVDCVEGKIKLIENVILQY